MRLVPQEAACRRGTRIRVARWPDAHSGATMVELLLALPVLLLLGLGLVQFTLVYQAKHALDHALVQAARQGAVDHASAESIRAGLAAGLAPYLYGASDWNGLLQAERRAALHVEEGAAAGWIRLRQRSPTQASFEDWSEPAIDEMGDPIPGTVEIANDNLDNRRLRMQPLSGVAGLHLSEPIGQASGQTLADANLLRLEMVYGVRLVVPVVAPLILRTLSIWNGCASASGALPAEPSAAHAETPDQAGSHLGLLVLGSVQALAVPQSWMCGFLGARGGDGRAGGRIPIRASATMRMMSTARRSDLTAARVDAASAQAASVTGPSVDSGAGMAVGARPGSGGASAPAPPLAPPAPPPSPPSAPSQRQPTGSPSGPASEPPSGPTSDLGNGFLRIGSDRPYPNPVVHPALCPA